MFAPILKLMEPKMIQTSTRPEFRRKLRLLHKQLDRTAKRDPMRYVEIRRQIQAHFEKRYGEAWAAKGVTAR